MMAIRFRHQPGRAGKDSAHTLPETTLLTAALLEAGAGEARDTQATQASQPARDGAGATNVLRGNLIQTTAQETGAPRAETATLDDVQVTPLAAGSESAADGDGAQAASETPSQRAGDGKASSVAQGEREGIAQRLQGERETEAATDAAAAPAKGAPDGLAPATEANMPAEGAQAWAAEETKEQETPDPAATPAAPPENLGEALRKAVQERALRAEKGVVRSMAAQYGMEENQLAALLQQARAEQEVRLTPAAQEQLRVMRASYGEKLRSAEVKAIGAKLGLIDPDAALKLMDARGITVTEQGEVRGARETLLALKQAKPYLFAQTGAWAQRMDGGGLTPLTGVEAAFYRKNPQLRAQSQNAERQA